MTDFTHISKWHLDILRDVHLYVSAGDPRYFPYPNGDPGPGLDLPIGTLFLRTDSAMPGLYIKTGTSTHDWYSMGLSQTVYLPAAPAAAANVSVTADSVTNRITMPSDMDFASFLRTYRDGDVYGSDEAVTADAGDTMDVLHVTDLTAGSTYSWRYALVSSAVTGSERGALTTAVVTTLPAS